MPNWDHIAGINHPVTVHILVLDITRLVGAEGLSRGIGNLSLVHKESFCDISPLLVDIVPYLATPRLPVVDFRKFQVFVGAVGEVGAASKPYLVIEIMLDVNGNLTALRLNFSDIAGN